MEGSSGSSNNNPGSSNLEKLQREQEEKAEKIRELKRHIEGLKVRLEQNKKKEQVPQSQEKKEAFNALSDKYNNLREEYIALLAQRPGEK